MRYAKFYIPLLVLILLKLSFQPLFESQELGSAANPIKIALTPSVDAQKITLSADELVNFLEQYTGYHFTYMVPASYIAVVEALGSGKADVAIMNTFSYLLAHEKYGARAVLKVVRRYGETTYKGQFITRVDSGIDSLQDIAGKRIAYVDPASTSGYLLPKAMLDSLGIKPAEEVFAMKHDNVVTMVYQGQVDVGATYYSPPDTATGEYLDARARVKQQFPDVFEKIKIIGFTQDIPNDPVVVRKDLPEEMVRKIVEGLLAFQSTPEGRKALYEIYSVEGFASATDADYDVIRNILRKQGISLEKLVKK